MTYVIGGIAAAVQQPVLTLHLSGNPGSFPRPLSRQEERECLEQWAQGDLSARNRLVEHNLRLVAHIIKSIIPRPAIRRT